MDITAPTARAASYLNRLHDATVDLDRAAQAVEGHAAGIRSALARGVRPTDHHSRLTALIEASKQYETLLGMWALVDGVTREHVAAAAVTDSRVWFDAPQG